MTGNPAERDARPLLGAAMMLLAVLSFTVLDSTAKYLSASLPVAQLVWGRFFFTLLLTLAFLPWLGLRGLCRTQRPLQQFLRGATLLGATGSLFLAVKYLPLAETYAITFVSPFMVALAAGLLLGERVDWRLWLVTIGGFAGVLVVIRPGSGAFTWHVVFPLAMATFWAANQVITRVLGASDRPIVTLFYTALIGTPWCQHLRGGGLAPTRSSRLAGHGLDGSNRVLEPVCRYLRLHPGTSLASVAPYLHSDRLGRAHWLCRLRRYSRYFHFYWRGYRDPQRHCPCRC